MSEPRMHNPNLTKITTAVEAGAPAPADLEANVTPIRPDVEATETTPSTPNRPWYKKPAVRITAAGVAALTASGLYLGLAKPFQSGDSPKGGSEQGQTANVPKDAVDFINAYKDRYADPLATYYSEAAYVAANPGQDLTIGPDYFSSYNFDATPNAAVSPIGFPILELKPGTEVNEQNSIDQFNQSIPALNRLMNILAKNPTPDQVKVVQDEFVEYSGLNNSNAQKLVDELYAVVQKNGTNAIYSVNEATADTKADPNTASIFMSPTPVIDGRDAAGAIDSFNNPMKLSIAITSYDKANKVTKTTEVLPDFHFSVMRAESADPNNVGIIGIGAK